MTTSPTTSNAHEPAGRYEHGPIPGSRRSTADLSSVRLGGILAVLGIAVQVPLGYLHPHHAQPNDSVDAFAEYAHSHDWVLVHLGQFGGALLVSIGLVVFASHLCRQPGLAGAAALVTGVAAVVAAGVFAVQMAVDGVALKSAVDAWAASGSHGRTDAFLIAEALRNVEKGLDALFQITTGVALLGLGLSHALGRPSRWLGLLGILTGASLLLAGVATARTGFSPLASTFALIPTVTLPAFLICLTARTWHSGAPTPSR